jgi:hypothetical protein
MDQKYIQAHPLLSMLPQSAPNQILGYPSFNGAGFEYKIKASHRLNEQDLPLFATTNAPLFHIARLICTSKSIRLKELLESVEFYLKIKKHLAKTKKVKDLCCGHGLVGLLIACLEEQVEEVELIDIRFTPAHQRLYDSLLGSYPQLQSKLKRREAKLSDLLKAQEQITDCFLLGVHACGQQSDLLLDLSKKHHLPSAIMPCCYPPKIKEKYEFLRDILGVVLTLDIQRTQELQALGFQVQWLAISPKITQMNRLILSLPQAPKQG